MTALSSAWQQAAASFAHDGVPYRFVALRVGLGTTLLLQALAVAPFVADLWGPAAFLDSAVVAHTAPRFVPRLDMLPGTLVSAAWVPRLVFATYVAALVCLVAGVYTRASVILVWALNLVLTVSAGPASYGVHAFVRIALFYCAFLLPLDAQARQAQRARIGLVALRAHLCIAYVASGIEKGVGIDWWTGASIWRAVARPDIVEVDSGWLADWPSLAIVAGLGTLVLEVGYAAFAASRSTRPALLLGICLLHASIAMVLGLWFFSTVMIVLNLAAWWPESWRLRQPRPTVVVAQLLTCMGLMGAAYSVAVVEGGLAAPPITAVQGEDARAAAPHLAGRTLEGREIDLAALRGHVVLVSAWATWCAPCHMELPILQELAARDGVRLVTVTVDDSEQATQVWQDVKKRGYDFPVIWLTPEIKADWELRQVPSLYVIDRNGRVAFRHEGFDEGTASTVRAEVASLLAESVQEAAVP
jgi:thiol-disulfide isomerase/thioredoxin